jgi:hypothetical protein
MRYHVRSIPAAPSSMIILRRRARRRYLGLTTHMTLQPPYAPPPSAPPVLGYVFAVPICLAFWTVVGVAIHHFG